MYWSRCVAGGSIDDTVDCPENLIVATDCICCLKQIMLNLGRKSTKFVHSGFIRFRAAVVDVLMLDLHVVGDSFKAHKDPSG
jgi:hypothetical protein